MIGLISILTIFSSVLSEGTDEKDQISEIQAYVANMSDKDFEAWIRNMEKLDRFLDIAKVMRIEWLIERMQSLLPEAVDETDEIPIRNLRDDNLFNKYLKLFDLDNEDMYVIRNKNVLILSNHIIGCIAYRYAKNIDKSPRDDTRAAACAHSHWSYFYARDIDQSPRDDTRAATCTNSMHAFWYAKNIDQSPRDDTRAAACTNAAWAFHYADKVDQSPRDDTRAAACTSAPWAYHYADQIDGSPRDDTRAAASVGKQWKDAYNDKFGE